MPPGSIPTYALARGAAGFSRGATTWLDNDFSKATLSYVAVSMSQRAYATSPWQCAHVQVTLS